MEKYGQRVAAARAHVGWSQGKLARELGIKQPSLSEFESGDATRSKHSYKIALLTGVSLHWLETGEGEMIAADDATGNKPADATNNLPTDLTKGIINIQQMPRDVPILGGAACGEDGLFEFNGQTLDYARRPPRLENVKDAYAVYVSGDSMSPWREHGDFVYVHPHQPVKIGDYVVVQLHPEKSGDMPRAYIKKLVRRTEKELRLLQFEPRSEIAIPMKKVKSVHRVIDWKEALGI